MGLTSADTQTFVIVAFLVFVALSMFLCAFTGMDRDGVGDFYTGNRSLRPWQNGLAITGDYLSALTVLGTSGIIALTGFDGLLLACTTVLALAVLMLLLAERLRAAGRFTVGDALADRFPGSPVRVAVCLATLAVCLPYLVLQLSGVSSLMMFLLGLSGSGARTVCIVILGALMVSFAATGGMRGTGLIQIVKLFLLGAALTVLVGWVLHRFDFDLGRLLTAARAGSGSGPAFLRPGLQYGHSTSGRLDLFSVQCTGVLSAAGLPHITMRLYAAPSPGAARRALRWAVWLTAGFCGGIALIGLAIPALVGDGALRAVDPSGATGILVLARVLDGSGLLLGAVACAVFITALAAVAGLTLAAASSTAHDLYAHALRRGEVSEGQEVRAARVAAMLVGAVAVLLATLTGGWNLQVLSVFALTFAASVLTPVLVYTLLWRGFTRAGALWALYGSAVLVTVLTACSPMISGAPGAVFPARHFDWFPLAAPGVVTVPAAFLLGWLGSLPGRRAPQARKLRRASTPVTAASRR